MEKEVAEKARLVEAHELNTRNNFMSIAENFQEMRRIRNTAVPPPEDGIKFQKAAEEHAGCCVAYRLAQGHWPSPERRPGHRGPRAVR